ncbi:MAG: arylesterase [Alphaproteobacteria bacterium]|nr:arylesterase [Alphaproteobacteria bacterium]
MRDPVARYATPSARAYGVRGLVINGFLAFLGLLLAVAPVRADPPVKLLVVGDSLTAGYGLPSEESFTAQLQAALKADGLNVTVVNAGVSGDTSAGGLARLDWLLADKPDVALVELGANDGLRGLDPQVTYDNLDAVLTRLGKRQVPVLLAGMYAPPNLGREYGEQFNGVFPRLAEKHGVLFYPFFLDGVAAERDLNQPDGIHPNAKGVAVLVARIMPHVKKLLGGPA